MADATIEVLIEVQNKMSGQLGEIQAQLGKLSDTSQQTSKRMSEGFTSSLENLKAFGNAAEAFDRIQSISVNTQIRIENAYDRVSNSQDRVRDAQDKVNQVTKDGTATTEDITRAQNELVRASRGLEIAQNNLKRVHESLWGTYINIGVQVTELLISLPKLYEAYKAMKIVTEEWNIAEAISLGLKNPLLLAAGLAAAGVGVYAVKSLMAADAANSLSTSEGNLTESFGTATSAMNDQQKAVDDLQKKLSGIVDKKGKDELKDELDISNQKKKADSLLVEAKRNSTKEEIASGKEMTMEKRIDLRNQYIAEKEVYDNMVAAHKAKYDDQRAIDQAYANDKIGIFERIINADTAEAINKIQLIDQVTQAAVNNIRTVAGMSTIAVSASTPRNIDTNSYRSATGMYSSATDYNNIHFTPVPADYNPLTRKSSNPFQDFIQRPGQPATNFSVNDTIIGMKDMSKLGGVNVTITGDIYGINARDISQALKKELGTKISL